LIESGYDAFADDLLEERRAQELPPFHFHALLRAEASAREFPTAFLQAVVDKASPPPSVFLLGPVPASMERRAGRYRAQLLVTSESRGALKSGIESCLAVAESEPLARKVRWSVDVDPLDLF
ncbi:MAG: primosomal protein N', partial [Pseudomonadales bacterium]|nr:primosomal protein N' [Pseudomonadales bacterium]